MRLDDDETRGRLTLPFTFLFSRLTEHVQDKSKLPILIFPEGELLRGEAAHGG